MTNIHVYQVKLKYKRLQWGSIWRRVWGNSLGSIPSPIEFIWTIWVHIFMHKVSLILN